MADIIRNEVTDAVLTRQTVREYKPVMLTDAQLDTLTAAAMMSPSGRNSQPCHVRFICNDAMLRQMQIDSRISSAGTHPCIRAVTRTRFITTRPCSPQYSRHPEVRRMRG